MFNFYTLYMFSVLAFWRLVGGRLRTFDVTLVC